MAEDKVVRRVVKLTKTVVESERVPAEGETRLWDAALKGYVLRVYASGRKVYAVKYRVGTRQRWLTIGPHSQAMTQEKARERAAAVLLSAMRGDDPAIEAKRMEGMTVNQLIDRYLADGPASKPDKRQTSWTVDKSNLDRHVRPTIGRLLVEQVTKDDVLKMKAQVSAGETAVDERTKERGRAIVKGGEGISHRVFSTTRAMFAWAIDRDMVPGPNPCVGIRLQARASVERFMTEDQAQRLIKALSDLEASGAVSERQAAIFRLLFLTGARRSEIAGLRWDEVDFGRGQLLLPPARTKAGGKNGSRRVTLNPFALQILRDLETTRKKAERFVFPATKGKSGHTTTESKVWREKVLPKAELVGVRIHDLRHSFASFALADGASLAAIGKALGHANARATERYAHLADEAVRDVADAVGRRFAR